MPQAGAAPHRENRVRKLWRIGQNQPMDKQRSLSSLRDELAQVRTEKKNS